VKKHEGKSGAKDMLVSVRKNSGGKLWDSDL